MAKTMPIGARGTAEETVEFKHTLTAHHPELPPVYSTPDMIRLMETAAFLALQPYCEGDEITVGTAIHVETSCGERDRGSYTGRGGAGVVRWEVLCSASKRSGRCPGDWPGHSGSSRRECTEVH